MNKFEKLVSGSQLAVVIAASPALDHVEFLSLDSPTDDAVLSATQRGLRFVGVVGLDKQFAPRIALAVELPVSAQKNIADAFLALCERAVRHAEDTLELQRLHALPDPRTAN